MSTPRARQLELSLFSWEGPQAVVVSKALKAHPARSRILRKVLYVRRFFPELAGRTIKVGLTRAASGMAVQGGDSLWLNPSFISYHTIAHEFVHLLQGEGGLPRSERSCDLYALARDWTLNDTPPYYLKIPPAFIDERGRLGMREAKLLYGAACRALQARSEGCRNYLVYFEETLVLVAAGAVC